jgi:hypothetical protein
MPGFKGNRKSGLTLTLYKKNHFDIDCLYHHQGNEKKTSSSTPNLKSPSIRTPSLLKKSLSIAEKINKTSKSPHAFAMCSIRTDLLKQENEKIDSL